MKKLLSILLALGLVLGMVVSAVPAAAYPPTDWGLVDIPELSTYCAGAYASYNITFDLVADLHGGTHSITVKFPAGTGVPETDWRNGDIKVGLVGDPAKDVFASEITVDGLEVTFLVPEDIVGPPTGARVLVQFVYRTSPSKHGIRNPETPCSYCYHVEVKTSRAPQNWFVKSGWDDDLNFYDGYSITAYKGGYRYYVDFWEEYEGIGYNFFPPVKVCNTYDFEIMLRHSPAGCFGYEDVQKKIRLISAPSSKAALNITIAGESFVLTLEKPADLYDEDFTDLEYWGDLFTIPGTYAEVFEATVHVDTVGEYEFCFELQYGGSDDPECPLDPITWSSCFTFDGKQWMDTAFIELEPKWNLISLPIVPFDSSVSSILAPLGNQFALRSIWHYDRCVDDWFVRGAGQTSLTDIEDGNAYWMRMMTEGEFVAFFEQFFGTSLAEFLWTADADYLKFLGDNVNPAFNFYRWYAGPTWRLWVFGTDTPMPPDGPSAYLQCEGWNMLGFRSTSDRPVGDGTPGSYLYGHTFEDHYTAVYGWDGTAWQSLATTSNMEVGFGYWVHWQEQRTVSPPL